MTAQEENNLAKKHHFDCIPHERRGSYFDLKTQQWVFWCYFRQLDIYVWPIKSGWVRAEINNGHFHNHRYFNTLEDALTNQNQKAARVA